MKQPTKTPNNAKLASRVEMIVDVETLLGATAIF